MSSVAQLKAGVDQVIRRRMSTSEFAPGDDKLRFMFEYWTARRHDGLLPARRDIDILDLRPMVGQIHLLDTTTRDPARFVFRVYGSVGSRLNQGYNYTNTAIGDYLSECYRKGLIEDYGAVAITTGPGNDTVSGGDGLDFVSYDERSAAVNANLASGTASIGSETDALSGIEAIIGGSGDDVLSGNDADYNLFIGGAGADTISGGASGATPGYNVDIVVYQTSAPVTASLATASGTQGGFTDVFGAGIEAIFGGSGADSLSGLDRAVATRGETLRGGAGNNTIDGLGGVDPRSSRGRGATTPSRAAVPPPTPSPSPTTSAAKAWTRCSTPSG